MVRTFIGIELEYDVIAEITQELSYLQFHFPEINWIRPQNLHITLKFLGNVQPNNLREVFSEIAALNTECLPFTISAQAVSLLPDQRRPKVVCAEVGIGTEQLISLQHRVEKACSILGYPEERKPFLPHITLGRIKKPSYAIGLENYLPDLANIDFGISEVEELIVYMSELGNHGAEYSPMYRVKLEG